MISPLKSFFSLVALLFIPFFASSAYATEPLEKVSLQLNWKYQFEFAGFIMAKEKGYYRDAGLDVNLLEYKNDVDVIDSVLSKKINYGIYDSSVVVHNGKLKPILLMATYFQQSPLVFVTSKEIQKPEDLIGKKIMGSKNELKYSSLALMLNHFHITPKNTQFLDHSYNIEDFIQHKVDAISAFQTNELFELNQRHIKYNIINPADYGFSMNAVNLFTSFSEALNHPDRTKKFILASNKGWQYAVAHIDETIAIIYNQYSTSKSIEALKFEAKESIEMMLMDFFDIGEINKELSIRTVKNLKYSGQLAATEVLGNFTFKDTVHKFNHGLHFSDQLKSYLTHKKVINMCIDPDWMPFESIKNYKHIGITADIIASFNKQLPIPIKLIQTKNWAESIDFAKKGVVIFILLRLKHQSVLSIWISHLLILIYPLC